MMAYAANETERPLVVYLSTLGTGGMIFIAVLALVYLIVIVWVIYDVMAHKKEMHPVDKLIWIIVVFALSVIGAILYYIVEKRKK